jgi:alpha,alpha-trehalase
MTQSITSPGPSPGDAPGAEDFRRVDDYGLLADCNSAALVDRYGSIDWLCVPRYDSASVFAAILDPAAGGHWSIRPAGAFSTERRYLPGTLVVETTFTTDTGTVRLIDAMAFAPGQRHHDLGYDAPHEVLRSVDGMATMDAVTAAMKAILGPAETPSGSKA